MRLCILKHQNQFFAKAVVGSLLAHGQCFVDDRLQFAQVLPSCRPKRLEGLDRTSALRYEPSSDIVDGYAKR